MKFEGKSHSTRKAFGTALCDLGAQHNTIVVLDGDVQNSTYTELFHKKFPDRFFQCFIAEQNMVSVGTGFALQGYIPFVATFAAFFTRAHDQIRMAAIGHAPLRLVGSHVGISIGADGPSQMGLEDIALMRAIPNAVVLSPADAMSTYKLTECMVRYATGISYMRTMRAETPLLYPQETTFSIGGCHILHQPDASRVCIVATGVTVFEALAAHDILKAQGIFVTVIDCYSIKPLPHEILRKAALHSQRRCIVVEDHYPEGGLGESIAHALSADNIQVHTLAVMQLPRSGTPEELRAFEKIDAQAVVQLVHRIISDDYNRNS